MLDKLRLHFHNTLPIKHIYQGRALRDNPEGEIGYILSRNFMNALGSPDRSYIFAIARNYFWKKWQEHCNIQMRGEKFKTGFTLSKEIYDDILKFNDPMTKLIVGHKDRFYQFKSKDLIEFVKEYKPFVINQNWGFEEVGIPLALSEMISYNHSI